MTITKLPIITGNSDPKENNDTPAQKNGDGLPNLAYVHKAVNDNADELTANIQTTSNLSTLVAELNAVINRLTNTAKFVNLIMHATVLFDDFDYEIISDDSDTIFSVVNGYTNGDLNLSINEISIMQEVYTSSTISDPRLGDFVISETSLSFNPINDTIVGTVPVIVKWSTDNYDGFIHVFFNVVRNAVDPDAGGGY